MKLCRRCGDEKHPTQFRIFKKHRRKDGRVSVYRKSWCRECERAYYREWQRRNPGYAARKSREYKAMVP